MLILKHGLSVSSPNVSENMRIISRLWKAGLRVHQGAQDRPEQRPGSRAGGSERGSEAIPPHSTATGNIPAAPTPPLPMPMPRPSIARWCCASTLPLPLAPPVRSPAWLGGAGLRHHQGLGHALASGRLPAQSRSQRMAVVMGLPGWPPTLRSALSP